MIFPLAADGALQLTADNAAEAWRVGFRRRPTDGALVGTTSTAGATQQHGFLRNAAGDLVYNAGGAVAQIHGGFARAADGSLCTAAADPSPAYKHHGLKFDTSGRVYAVVLT
jgi:hypothetical protein